MNAVGHFTLMVLFALMISLFFGTLLRDTFRGALFFTAKMFVILLLASLAAAWLMYGFPPPR